MEQPPRDIRLVIAKVGHVVPVVLMRRKTALCANFQSNKPLTIEHIGYFLDSIRTNLLKYCIKLSSLHVAGQSAPTCQVVVR
jgi:hypothetical protein